MTGGRALPPSSPYAADDGRADPALAVALADLAAGRGAVPEVVAALARARVLVPVLAELEASEMSVHGVPVDKEASTAVVALRAPDGRTALPVFSSIAEMTAWSRSARPVPAPGPLAAASAVQEGWELLVLDPAGAAVVVPRPAVHALASGLAWRPAVELGEVRPDVVQAVDAALAGVVGLGDVRTTAVVPGRAAEVAVVLGLRPGLDRDRLDALLAETGRRLAADATVTTTVDSVELRVVLAR